MAATGDWVAVCRPFALLALDMGNRLCKARKRSQDDRPCWYEAITHRGMSALGGQPNQMSGRKTGPGSTSFRVMKERPHGRNHGIDRRRQLGERECI